jgi:hypothetical protein
MGTLVAAAVFAPVVGAVAAYNAWAVYLACRKRYFPSANAAAVHRAQAAAAR